MSGKRITSKQVEIYMKARKEIKTQVVSAAKAGISERSGRMIEKSGGLYQTQNLEIGEQEKTLLNQFGQKC